MYAAPPEIQTRIFARVPDQFRRQGQSSVWANLQRHGAKIDCFLEGPSFDRQGNLHVVDVAWGRIFRIDRQGHFTLLADYDGEPNGLKIHRDGRIFIADHKHGILVLDTNGGAPQPLLVRPWLERFKGVNDLCFASNGDLYFTDQGQTGLNDPSGRVYRLAANGRLDLVLDRVPSPNGLVLNHDETILYVAVTRANAIWRLPLLAHGRTAKVGVFVQLSGGLAGPDGMALDEAGNLAVAHCGLGTVWMFNRLGEPIARLRSTAGIDTTNLAYGGPGRRTLFITESETGSILAAELPVAGRAMYGES